MVEFVTPHYTIRSLGPADDLRPMQSWLADPALMAPLNLPARRMPLDDLARYVATFNDRTLFMLGIFERTSMQQVGYLMLDVNPVHLRGHINILIAAEAHRAGRVTMQLHIPFYDWAFGTLGLNKVVAEIIDGNEASIRRAQATGYVFEARLRAELRRADGSGFVDQVRMAMFKEHWPAHRARLAALLAQTVAKQ